MPSHLFDFLLPLHELWWAIFGDSLAAALGWLVATFEHVPALSAIGAYGLAIVALTVGIKLALWPLYHHQLVTTRRSQEEQKKLSPQLQALRKQHRDDPMKLQEATMELYREHGINPLGALSGCLPAMAQMPILIALYWVFMGNAQHHLFSDHFLFIPHLNDLPTHHLLLSSLPVPQPAYLVIPLLAALTTYVQSKMMQQPLGPNSSEQDQQAQSLTGPMNYLMPLMIAYFAVVAPVGLGLYWAVSNLITIGQQYVVTGWGSLLPRR